MFLLKYKVPCAHASNVKVMFGEDGKCFGSGRSGRSECDFLTWQDGGSSLCNSYLDPFQHISFRTTVRSVQRLAVKDFSALTMRFERRTACVLRSMVGFSRRDDDKTAGGCYLATGGRMTKQSSPTGSLPNL